MQLPFESFRTPSTKSGRKYCRLGKTDHVACVQLVTEAETMFMASRKARILHFAIADVPVLGGAGKGVRGIRLEAGDELLGVVQLSRPSDTLRVRNDNDSVLSFGQTKYQVTSRGGRGVNPRPLQDAIGATPVALQRPRVPTRNLLREFAFHMQNCNWRVPA